MKEQLLIEGEGLFFSRGFKNVSLKTICSRVKMKPASLYHYFPGGKEELYLKIVERRVLEFKRAIEEFAAKGNSLEEVLTEFCHWYINQPPMNMNLIAEFDMPFLSEFGRKAVSGAVLSCVFEPLGQVFRKFSSQIKPEFEPFYLVGMLSALLFSAQTAARKSRLEPKQVVDKNLRIFLYGASKS